MSKDMLGQQTQHVEANTICYSLQTAYLRLILEGAMLMLAHYRVLTSCKLTSGVIPGLDIKHNHGLCQLGLFSSTLLGSLNDLHTRCYYRPQQAHEANQLGTTLHHDVGISANAHMSVHDTEQQSKG